MKKTPEEIKKMARSYENYHPEDSDLVGAEKGGLFHGFIKGYTQCQQDNEEQLDKLFKEFRSEKYLEDAYTFKEWLKRKYYLTTLNKQ